MRVSALEARLEALDLPDATQLPKSRCMSWHVGDEERKMILPGEKVVTLRGLEGTVDRFIQKTQKYRIRTRSGIVKVESSEVSLSAEYDDEMLPISSRSGSVRRGPGNSMSNLDIPFQSESALPKKLSNRNIYRARSRRKEDFDIFHEFENRLVKRIGGLIDRKVHDCKEAIFDKLEEESLQVGKRRKEIETIIHDEFRGNLIHEVQGICSSIFNHKVAQDSKKILPAVADEVNIRYLSCFHGRLSRGEAERRLTTRPVSGRYLIRESKSFLVISALTSGQQPYAFYHIRVHERQTMYALDSGGKPILPFKSWKKIVNPDAPTMLSQMMLHPIRNPQSTDVYKSKLGEQVKLQRSTLEDIFRIDTIANCISDYAGWVVDMHEITAKINHPILQDMFASLDFHEVTHTYLDTTKYTTRAICSCLSPGDQEITIMICNDNKGKWTCHAKNRSAVNFQIVAVNHRGKWKTFPDKEVLVFTSSTFFSELRDTFFQTLVAHIQILPPMACEL